MQFIVEQSGVALETNSRAHGNFEIFAVPGSLPSMAFAPTAANRAVRLAAVQVLQSEVTSCQPCVPLDAASCC